MVFQACLSVQGVASSWDLKRRPLVRKHKRLSFSTLSSAAQYPIAPFALSAGENKAIGANEPTSLASSKKLIEKGVKQSIWATPLFLVGKRWPCSCPAINQCFCFFCHHFTHGSLHLAAFSSVKFTVTWSNMIICREQSLSLLT